MKKLFLILSLFFISAINVSAVETSLDDVDMMDYSHTTQNLKHFSDKEYQDAIEKYKNNFQKPKKVKKKDIKTPTTPFSDAETNPEYKVLDEIINHKGTIMIPTLCTTENGQQILPGHYSMEYYSDNYGTEWLILSQGTKKTAKIKTTKSQASSDESTINYAYAVGKGDIIKLLYGNIDVAVEAKLYVVN